MTREEQLYIAADKEAAPFRKFNTVYADCVVGGFVQGAKWADEHPKEGLVSLDKACEWLESALRPYAGYSDTIDIVDSFRKVMEG